MRKNLKIQLAILAVLAVIAGAVGLLAVDGRAPAGPSSAAHAETLTPARQAQAAVVVQKTATNQTPTVRGTLPYVLTSVKPFEKPLRLAAEAMGAKTVCFLGRDSVLVEATPEARARLRSDSRFREVTEYAPANKVQPALAALIAAGADAVDVSIVSLADADRQIVQTCLENGGGEMLKGCINEGDTLRARLPAALVATLAARGDVRWMERFVRPQLMNDKAVQPEAMNVLAVWDTSRGLGLTGVGQKITTSDTGIDTGDTSTMHLDLRSRVKGIYISDGCDKYDGNGHGTHTAGSIVGEGVNCDDQYRGTAHGADLYAWFCGKNGGRGVYLPKAASDLFRPDGVEAYIHSASWGSDMFGQYTTECVEYDRYVWNNSEFLPVFSAGNAGESGSTTIGSPGSAKNLLTVGATRNLPYPAQTASFSSRGPCLDGRTKPDIAAPGNPVTSTRSSKDGGDVVNGYTQMSGTSMSCPLTAGSVVLVRQWLTERMGFVDVDGKRPTAALMKAVITGGAKGASLPNNNQGWGRVDLADTLAPTNGRAVKLVDRIPFAADEEFEYLIETTNAAPLDVQLAWVDYPGSTIGSQSTPRLVNDLDLTVESLDGAGDVLLGNGGSVADTVNNMESVRIASAMPGRYLIKVKCSNIAYDYEDGGAAAIYVRGAFDPDYEPAGLERVRIARTPDVRYRTLDAALADVQADDVVEILDAVTLRKSAELSVSCTIVATNADAAASLVTRINDAALTVGSSAKLTLSNVVFSASEVTLVTVAAGGNVTLKEGVVPGVDAAHVAISTADADGFILAGPLSEKILFHCDAATKEPDQFGTFSCDHPTAQESATKLICVDDANRETRGMARSDDGALVWKVTDVPVSDSVGYFVDETGTTNAYARLDRVFERYASRLESGETIPEIVIRKTVDPNARVLSQALTVAGVLTIRSETATATVVPTNTARFTVVEGGSLVLTNVVFSDYRGPRLFSITGGEMTLAKGAKLRNLATELTTSTDAAGVTLLEAGTFTMMPGAAITGCSAQGNGSDRGIRGGGICAFGGTLRLLGGNVTGCSAVEGGGVYVWNLGGTEVELADSFTCKNNRPDNLRLSHGTSGTLPTVTAALGPTARIGLSGFEPGDEGLPFAAVTGTLTDEELRAAESVFSCDNNGDVSFGTETVFYAAYEISGGETNLIWKVREPGTGEVDPEDAKDLVIYGYGTDGAVTNYYDSISAAFAYLKGDCTVVMLEGEELFDSDLVVPFNVRLVSASPYGDTYLYRKAACAVRISAGASLTVSNVVVYGCVRKPFPPCDVVAGGACTLMDVCGGSLTLESGSGVADAPLGDGSWAAAGVCVSSGGAFTMKSGSFIDSCWNSWLGASAGIGRESDWGRGGGLLLLSGTAHLEGGEIWNCSAMKGAGVYVANEATAFVSGDFTVEENWSYDLAGGEWSVVNNFEFDGNGRIVLCDELTGDVGVTRGNDVTGFGIGEFGRVGYSGEVTNLVSSAANFHQDADVEVTGRIVTNATGSALLVWSTAVTPEGIYVDDNGTTNWVVVADTPGPTPEPEYADPTPIAFQSITRSSEKEWELVVTNRVQWAEYRLIWTDDLTKGFTTTGAWEQATQSDAWTTNVLFAAPAPAAIFWKAEAQRGTVPNK